MNKKFLSAILFGALMVTSTGTFVSCKDYDDDIENLQGQISANSSAIAELKALIGDGNYVTSISVSGNSLVVNTKNGSATVALPECEDEVGSICTVSEEGELLIDGKATGIKVAEGTTEDGEFLPAVKIVDGEWAVLQEDGTYKSTGVAVSSVAVTGDKQNGYVLTVKDAEGTATVVELPTAASLITSITVAPNASQNDPKSDYAKFNLAKATFAHPGDNVWLGERELPSDQSVVYSPTTTLNIRVNPVDAPVQDVAFYLTNTKDQTLSQIEMTASTTQQSWNGPITIGGINGRSVTDNGLWTLGESQYILNADNAATFEKELADKGVVIATAKNATPDYTKSAAFAVNANNKARSEYSVAASLTTAGDLKEIYFYNAGAASKATVGETGKFVVNVGQTYKLYPSQSGLLYDQYFTADEAQVIETFGVVFDDLNGTFKVTKRPDVQTPDDGFKFMVHTIDIWGNIEKTEYTITLSAQIENATATYDEVVYDLSRINDGNNNNDFFSLPISTMKSALGNNWTTWANSVDLTNTKYQIYTNANVSDGYVGEITASTTTGLKAQLRKSDGVTSDVNVLNNVRFIVGDADVATYTVDTQYYIKVTFYTEGDHPTTTVPEPATPAKYINHIVVPVKFTAPTVADQFALKSGYVVNGVVNAYYYNYKNIEDINANQVQLYHYFDKADMDANITLDTQTTLVTLGNGTELQSHELAVLSTSVSVTDDKGKTFNYSRITDKLNLVRGEENAYVMTDGTNRELGYGKELVVNASNATYDGWKYKTDAQKAYSFKIKLMSPIFEGTIRPVDASTIKVTANAEEGFAITKDMIELADYNKNLYSVVPDVDGEDPDNLNSTETLGATYVDVWSALQIDDVWVTKDPNNTYIKKFSMQGYKVADGEVTQEGAIVVYADPLPNTQATSMTVNVKDCWGYLKAQEVSVTIVKK